VSFIKNLNNQLKEKDKIIKHLENELDLLKKSKSNKVVEEEVMEEGVEEEEEEDEEEVEEEEDEEVVEVEDEEVAEVEDEEEVEEEEVEVAEVEDEEVEVEEVEVEEVEEVEVEFSEKKLKPPNSTSRKLKYYFITDDENKDIYEKLENGELGEHVGKLIGKQNKPFFFE